MAPNFCNICKVLHFFKDSMAILYIWFILDFGKIDLENRRKLDYKVRFCTKIFDFWEAYFWEMLGLKEHYRFLSKMSV